MRVLGQICLLAAFVASGYAAVACPLGWWRGHRGALRGGRAAAIVSAMASTATMLVLAWALFGKDFRFAYVVQYSSRLLPWHYSLSALWVGQAGSLLLWAWMLGVLALAYRLWPTGADDSLRDLALGVLQACECFLLAILVFAADPMAASLVPPSEGAGLNSLLHHPAMLIHPPVVFAGYALWTIPFAVAVAALWAGKLDADWVQAARPWALAAWLVLGIGILLGAEWAYEELGWGGYWAWDPVENGSLVPWLTGTALLHTFMAWRYRGILKKTALSLAIATFGLCNFATFLTRSGIFDSVHAFSQSPIGWMFLGFMAVLAVGGTVWILARRRSLAPEQPISGLWTREAFVAGSAALWTVLAAVAAGGTAVLPLSQHLFGHRITVGPEFYNRAVVPVGLLLIAATALVPVLRWGQPAAGAGWRVVCGSAVAGIAGVLGALALGARHPVALAVVALATLAVCVLAGGLWLDAQRRAPGRPWFGIRSALYASRRQYAGFLVHLGFVCLAIGVTGSSLGTRRLDVTLNEGAVVEWAGRSIRYAALVQTELPDRLVAEAVLDVSRPGGEPVKLRPARHLHLLQNEWTTEVAIHSAWGGDFYTILHNGEGGGRVSLTFVENPLMRWIWFGGGLSALGAVIGLWPARVRTGIGAPHAERGQRGSRRPAAMRATAAGVA